MLKFLRKFRKKFKTACLTAALATCWQVGQAAKADTLNWGDEVTIRFSGTVSHSTTNLSHMYLIYGTGSSGGIEFPMGFIKLPNIEAGQVTGFNVLGNTPYANFIWWYTAGLYGDTNGGYNGSTNGVTLGIWANEGDSWQYRVPGMDEATAFTYLLNDTPENLPAWQDWHQGWHINEFYDPPVIETAGDLYDFSTAAKNGQIELKMEVVPEPVSIILFGTGGMIIVALRRRNQ
jgi:hypothetical protein